MTNTIASRSRQEKRDHRAAAILLLNNKVITKVERSGSMLNLWFDGALLTLGLDLCCGGEQTLTTRDNILKLEGQRFFLFTLSYGGGLRIGTTLARDTVKISL